MREDVAEAACEEVVVNTERFVIDWRPLNRRMAVVVSVRVS